MLNRKIAPQIKEIKKLHLPASKLSHLSNGIPVNSLNLGTQKIIKLEIVYKAGRPVEIKKLASRATASLLKEGTKARSGSQIAEQIDFYGGNLNIPVNLDFANVTFYCLEKHFSKLIPLLADILHNPAFPEDELQNYKQRHAHFLKVDLTKTDVVAYREVTEKIFNKAHPYGYNSVQETYQALQRDDLVQHFQNCYTPANCNIFVSGKFDEHQILKLLDEHFGQKKKGKKPNFSLPKIKKEIPQKINHELPGAVQTSIRLGKKLFNRKHEDYNGVYVLNTILGGYFGSRLMCNIREEKGYTYNIFSTLDTMLYDGYFYVGTEVGNEFVKSTLHEIYKEMESLQNDLINDHEMKMVKNYLLGNLMTMLDGPLNVSGIIKTMVLEDLKTDDFHNLIYTIQEISKEEIRDLAQKYLNKKDMWEIVVGKKS